MAHHCPGARFQSLATPLCALTLFVGSAAARGSDDPSALCLAAARAAAEQTGVPYQTLLAISVVETGRDLQPWPWTVNLGGDGHWLATADEASALISEQLNAGATNIDIGCFQLNYRWHAAAFRSVEDMLDPARNALYAAGYLARHYARTGDWGLAAAAYHSATPDHADRYLARYEQTVADLSGGPTGDASGDPSGDPVGIALTMDDRSNGFPLLIAGSFGRNGSIVPATSGGRRLVGGP